MKLLKWIPEAKIGVVELDDGGRLTITGDSPEAVEKIADMTNRIRVTEKAEKEAAKSAEKEDARIEKLADKAKKAVPDVLAHLNAIQYRDSADYLPELQAAMERLV